MEPVAVAPLPPVDQPLRPEGVPEFGTSGPPGLTPPGAAPEDLRPETVHLLEVGAVLGPSFPLTELAALLERPVSSLLGEVKEAMDGGVLLADDESLAFSSRAVHEELYRAIPAPVRTSLHRQVGKLLADQAPQRATSHLLKGIMAGDGAGLAQVDEVVDRLRAGSPAEAAELAVAAWERSDPADGRRWERAARASDAVLAGGNPAGALALCEEARAAGPPLGEAAGQLELRSAAILLAQGETEASVKLTELVLSQPGLNSTLFAKAELLRQMAWMMGGQVEAARRRAEAILAGVGDPAAGGGDPALSGALSAALLTLGFLAWEEGRVSAALGFIRAGRERCRREQLVAGHTYFSLLLAFILTVLGELAEAEQILEESARDIEATRATIWAAVPAIMRSRISYTAGRLEDARVQAEEGLGLAGAMGTHLLVPLACSVLVSVAALRGNLADVERYRARAAGSGSAAFHLPGAVPWPLLVGLSSPGERETHPAESGDGGDQPAMADLLATRQLQVEEAAVAALLVRDALERGDRRRAERAVARAEDLADANPSAPSLSAAARHARGLVEGNPDLLRQAAADYRQPWAHALATEDAGVALGAQGDRDGSRSLLEEALASFRRLTAAADEARVRSRLREMGLRPCHWRRRERPVTGWASLTDTEESVAELVSQGLTNREAAARMFLSRHTIDFHLRQIFRKLEIVSRVELTRLVTARRSDPDG